MISYMSEKRQRKDAETVATKTLLFKHDLKPETLYYISTDYFS